MLTAALPLTSHQSTPTPETSQQQQQQQPAPLDFPEVELLNSDGPPSSDEGLNPLENPDLFEGDIVISPEEIELYYGKQSNTHVRPKTLAILL